ncbi:flagellar protein FlaG [Lysinibacillus capsici]|uniref:flagellar protein FlaG n=1 Tax=Lysinibacillus capsici TaxID=2115968 RepID=UPI00272F5505|nr:flagellar protein FlaG [Lysinibacillus capsici]MDP1393415.1 flagellar protein FlaG [Lysinibacillus capsici]MDP1413889.1 flagellar protein FlaG [Lysinibacillus capsici]MDP1429173.1 flagellar protein FlaG [Lysinibacillus capsici]
MRITSQGQSIEEGTVTPTKASEKIKSTDYTHISSTPSGETALVTGEEKEISKEKLQQAVDTMNNVLEANSNTAKFVYHEGLDRFYVTVVNKETDQVVKEIPPKKLLDAFYEMQKMLGLIVDEKI